jgi:hypothetical protein
MKFLFVGKAGGILTRDEQEAENGQQDARCHGLSKWGGVIESKATSEV